MNTIFFFQGDTQVKENGPHPLDRAKPTQITDYGLSPIVLEKMKIRRTLSAMEKVICIITPPVYQVYRGYIVFAFSVTMCVCLCVNFFYQSKISRVLLYLLTK